MTTNGSADAGGKQELRRDVTVWGSYTWGYADVGADIYAALGLVIAAAEGLAPLAFALAGVIYILIGSGLHRTFFDLSGGRGRPLFRFTRARGFLGIRRRSRAFIRLHHRYRTFCRGFGRLC